MPHSKYLIIGSSHAALQAIAAIRARDPRGSLAVLTRESRLPYSPTILPYIVSAQKQPDDVGLRDTAYFDCNNIEFVRDARVTAVDPASRTVRVASGVAWTYERLLLATGADPSVPPIPGLADVPFHVLRTMDDAIGMRDAMQHARSAVVIGAGLCAMHAAENMARAGIAVTIVEIRDCVLPDYVSRRAGRMIERFFAAAGVQIRTGRTARTIARDGGRCVVTLDDGEVVAADLLMIGTGMVPATDYLAGTNVAINRGIVVDERMRTSAAAIWAAGDVAETPGFWGGQVVNGILPGAAVQGRVAGTDMAGDGDCEPYAGAVPLNTYHFFDHYLISVGICGDPGDPSAFEFHEEADEEANVYRRVVLKDGRLVGISTINDYFDAGIMWRLILGRTDLSTFRAGFLARPLETGRVLMSQMWR